MIKTKILWVDDEVDLLKPHIIFLENKDFLIQTCNNGSDAVEIIRNENFDAVLLDENMPGLNGIETLTLMRDISSNIPIIMITKSEEENIMDDAIGNKISDYLIKPVNPKQILLSLKKNLNDAEIIFDQLPVIRGNFPATLSLMQNLLSNALKYSQNRDKPIIKINSIEQEHDYKISVADNGIGVEAEYFKQIFEPFKRLEAKEEYAGTGIGLAICKKIIQQLSGEIWIESELGVGSVFYFTIPKT